MSAIPMKPEKRTAAPVTYPRDTVLTLSQLAAALQVEERTAQGMDLPYFYVGKRQRFLWGQCLDMLAQRATGLSKAA